MPKRATYIIEFKNSETLNKSKLIDCRYDPLENKEIQMARLRIYKNTTSGKIIIPTQEYTTWSCGYCYWNISVTSNKINKTFYKEMFSPINLTMTFYGKNQSIINSPEIIFFNEVLVSLYDYRTWEMLGAIEEK